MAAYELVFRKSASKELRRVPKVDLQRILRRIEGLIGNLRPAEAEKLTGYDLYRVRQGAYRIVYEVTDDKLIVTIVRIAHRRNVYRRL
ncbi:type II toxin-antitoxin system RelE family toxin [Algiphilus sp.]|uniref:type II toxin-antitoxin system RelE family toxin n=1 Tax=Algiphilus sp. TaxID=1872431 RepID=UPI003B523041